MNADKSTLESGALVIPTTELELDFMFLTQRIHEGLSKEVALTIQSMIYKFRSELGQVLTQGELTQFSSTVMTSSVALQLKKTPFNQLQRAIKGFVRDVEKEMKPLVVPDEIPPAETPTSSPENSAQKELNELKTYLQCLKDEELKSMNEISHVLNRIHFLEIQYASSPDFLRELEKHQEEMIELVIPMMYFYKAKSRLEHFKKDLIETSFSLESIEDEVWECMQYMAEAQLRAASMKAKDEQAVIMKKISELEVDLGSLLSYIFLKSAQYELAQLRVFIERAKSRSMTSDITLEAKKALDNITNIKLRFPQYQKEYAKIEKDLLMAAQSFIQVDSFVKRDESELMNSLHQALQDINDSLEPSDIQKARSFGIRDVRDVAKLLSKVKILNLQYGSHKLTEFVVQLEKYLFENFSTILINNSDDILQNFKKSYPHPRDLHHKDDMNVIAKTSLKRLKDDALTQLTRFIHLRILNEESKSQNISKERKITPEIKNHDVSLMKHIESFMTYYLEEHLQRAKEGNATSTDHLPKARSFAVELVVSFEERTKFRDEVQAAFQ